MPLLVMSKKKIKNNNCEEYVKIALIGNEYVGKTSIVRRYVHHGYETGYIRTIGGDLWHKKIKMGDKIVNLNLLDTGGEKQQRELITNLFRNTDAVMLVYDINNVQSFEAVDDWVNLLLKYCDDNPLIILVGNKSDLRNELDQEKEEISESVTSKQSNQVSIKDLKMKAKQHNMSYCEVSAKTGRNIEEPFINLLEDIFYNREEPSEYGGSLVQSVSGPDGMRCCSIS